MVVVVVHIVQSTPLARTPDIKNTFLGKKITHLLSICLEYHKNALLCGPKGVLISRVHCT